MVSECNDHDLLPGDLHDDTERESTQDETAEPHSTGFTWQCRKGNDVVFDQVQR